METDARGHRGRPAHRDRRASADGSGHAECGCPM